MTPINLGYLTSILQQYSRIKIDYMPREHLPIESCSTWSKLNNVELNGVTISTLDSTRGSGVVATRDASMIATILMRVPQDLVLSLERVWIYAKSDKVLRDVLEAAGDYARVLLTVNTAPVDASTNVGASNPWTQYVKFLPCETALPIFWTEEEREALQGTTLYPAVKAKLKSLEREFNHIRSSTASIGWCQQWMKNCVTFDDWKQVDAMYRSRALDMPGTGHAMVPCIDMANHSAGNATIALYDTNLQSGDALLLLAENKNLKANDEVTITYGDEKGACEMVFSYGFIEPGMTNARELFLDLEIEDDDPLKPAKQSMFDLIPGFKLFVDNDHIGWEGLYIWLMCVNEEDGLEFRLMQKNDGDTELSLRWSGSPISDMANLESHLKESPAWNLFLLRAIVIMQSRVENQLIRLEETELSERQVIRQLQKLEGILLLQAYETFEEQKIQLMNSDAVVDYQSRI